MRDIRARAKEAGFRVPKTWNPSDVLRRSKGLAIRPPEGWEITDAGKQRLENLGVVKAGPKAIRVAADLRGELSNVADPAIRSFVEEAIGCYEAEFYRSAIVMSWVAAVAVLHNHVHAERLAEFNAEARRMDAKWRDAKTTDDLGRMKEADLLDRIHALSIIGKDVKKELKNCLDLRNSCGHPNSLRIGANTAARHVEMLLLNVFRKFP